MIASDGAAAATRPRARWVGRLLTLLAGAVGLALAALVIRASGARRIGEVLLGAGAWAPLVVLLHTPQTLCSALGWGELIERRDRPSWRRLYLLRWVRESVNSLLPVAQVGGDVVRARLLARGGVPMGAAAASCARDVTLELAAQVVFTLLGLGLLTASMPTGPVLRVAASAAVGLALIVAALFAALRLSNVQAVRSVAARAAEGLARRLGRTWRAGEGQGASWRPDRRAQAASFGWHLASWLLGAVETWAALRAVGLTTGLREAMVIESLTQALRAAAFAVPGALGVQEGGMILICGLFSIAPARAVALSLVRRLRELVLGVPGLVVWRRLETHFTRMAAA